LPEAVPCSWCWLAKVSGIIEAASKKQIAAKAFQILRSAGALRLRQGFNYLRDVISQGIPVYNSHVVSKAIGNEAVNKAVITRIDSSWKPLKGTEREIPIDAVAVGYSLIPSIELTRVCGCNHQYDERLGYWKVQRDARMETSVPGVFVAGDAVHIKGYAAAIDEGRLAGLEVCLQLGYIDNNRAEPLIRALQKKLRQAARFGEIIDAVSSPQAGILDIISDDTFVCRCEEVVLADIRTAVENGASDVNDIKRRTRLGMGHCQGRFCGQVMNELLWKLSGKSRERELFTPRIPAKPVPFKALMR
jgi:bacterioferritin-associated ferredoxin